MAVINLNNQAPFDQDNIPYKKYIGIIPPSSGNTTTNAEILAAINDATFDVSEIQIPYIECVVYVDRNGESVQQYKLYAHSKGKGHYGNGTYQGNPRTPVVFEDLFIIKENYLSENSFEELGAEVIDLGNIGALDIEDAVNLSVTTYELEESTIYFFKVIRNNNEETYLFVGDLPRTIGVGETPIESTDFELLVESGTGVAINQNNFSRTINVEIANLSGIGTIEAQLATYINNLNYNKQDTDADIWIITDEEIDGGEISGGYYDPVNRVGSNIYDIVNLDNKKYIYLTAGTTIRLGEILSNNFDAYLRNSTGSTVNINNGGSGAFSIPTGKVLSIPAGEEIRIRKNVSGAYIITGNLTDASSSDTTVITITESLVLSSTHNGKVIHINNGASNITITVPVQGGAEYKVGFIQLGTGNVDFVADSTIINSTNGLRVQGQGYACFLTKDSTTDYNLLGNVIAIP